MEELIAICKEKGLSFHMDYNNHRRFGLSIREYAAKFWADPMTDEEGERWLKAMERRDTIVSITIYNKQMRAAFQNIDVDISNCIKDTLRSIQDGLHVSGITSSFDYTLAPLD